MAENRSDKCNERSGFPFAASRDGSAPATGQQEHGPTGDPQLRRRAEPRDAAAGPRPQDQDDGGEGPRAHQQHAVGESDHTQLRRLTAIGRVRGRNIT